MKNCYEEESGNSFNEASDIAIRLRVLAGEIYNAEVNLEWLKRQMFSATASGEYLDHLASQRGLERKQATRAHGSISFYVNEEKEHNIIIPIGTVVATADSEPIRFVTTEQGEIQAGTRFTAVWAEAEQAGTSGNIGVHKAVIPVSVPAEIDLVRNNIRYVDGTDTESDEALRERIKSSYLNCANGANAAFYEQLAMSVEGIAKVGVVGKARGNGTVNVYVSGESEGVSDELVAQVQAIMNENRELNVNVLVAKAQSNAADLNVTVWAKNGYGVNEVTRKCTKAFSDYIYSLPMGAKSYLTAIGKCLMDTGCIENYLFNVFMEDTTCTQSEYFVPGDITIEVR